MELIDARKNLQLTHTPEGCSKGSDALSTIRITGCALAMLQLLAARSVLQRPSIPGLERSAKIYDGGKIICVHARGNDTRTAAQQRYRK
jgi:hypothetical protein